ncbi:MAG: NAD(P)-dependent oxidoreductase [Butyrivibrio sp.]
MKKILICDYENVCEKDYSLTVKAIEEIMGKAEVVICAYAGKEELYDIIQDAEGMITAFLPLDKEFFKHAKKLKCISLNAVGYSNVDLAAAKECGVTVCHIAEYCTEEVAEHTLALIGALNRHLKFYTYEVEQRKQWSYSEITGRKNLSSQTIAVFGFGKIGKRVAGLAKAYNMKVLAVDPYLDSKTADEFGVLKVSAEEALENADIVTNHMNLTKDNYHFFNDEAFGMMKRKPLFINVGRGACVDEKALEKALNSGQISGAGLDVLEDENPVLEGNTLLHRDNVLITPHSAFYSAESIEKLQTVSGSNMAHVLKGEPEKAEEMIKLHEYMK